MVMAVMAAGLFAYMALLFLQAEGDDRVLVQARVQRARLSAAADAGVMIALHGLGLEDRARRWPFDGRPRQLYFDGVALTVAVEDEWGKIPLNRATPPMIRRLLRQVGVTGEALDSLAESLLDWMDRDDLARPGGAESRDYIASGSGVIPRNGTIQSLEELSHVRGMTPPILARIAPSVSVYFGEFGTFSDRTATPLALMVMRDLGENAVEVQARGKDLSKTARRPVEDIAEDLPLRGRPLSIHVTARLPDGATVTRVAVVEFTGDAGRPYWVRDYR
jgi:general secretion pathway protein K